MATEKRSAFWVVLLARRPKYSNCGRNEMLPVMAISVPPPKPKAKGLLVPVAPPKDADRCAPPKRPCTYGTNLSEWRKEIRGPNVYASAETPTPLGEPWYTPKSPTKPNQLFRLPVTAALNPLRFTPDTPLEPLRCTMDQPPEMLALGVSLAFAPRAKIE